MPKINLLNHLSTRGVDMKSNPLSLGNKKLHAATNLIFEEGVIRTRYSWEMIPLGPEGRFQGACKYEPSKGLSYAPLSSAASGLVSVVEGAVFFNSLACQPAERISTQVFCGKGDVNIFQAEDYIILQNLNTSTFWWRGEGDIVESPGSVEEIWENRNMPETIIEPVIPTAYTYDCGENTGNDGSGGDDGDEGEATEPSLTLTAPTPNTGPVAVAAGGGFLTLVNGTGPVGYTLTGSLAAIMTPSSGTIYPNVPIPYTITCVVEGVHSISATNNGGITNPANVAFTAVAGDDVEITISLSFYSYGTSYDESFEDTAMTGSVGSGVFVGECSKGPITMQWDAGMSEWVITFDDPVPTTGDGDAFPFHGPMTTSGATTRLDPSGFYVHIEAAPFPNWTANVPSL